MNIHVPSLHRRATQAAEGLPRWRWTVAEIRRMVEASIIREEERFELIGGELVPMSPKGIAHELVKKELQRYWFRMLPDDIDLVTETTLWIGDHDFLEPDFIFWPRAIPLQDVTVDKLTLLVEVADSSLVYDTGRKARIYAGLGLHEYWVIDAVRLVTRIHREPAAAGFATSFEQPATERLVPSLASALAVSLSSLGLEPQAGE
jgi:Uma2 family endonuclease